MTFSLETASDYVKDEKACFFGFKCVIVGYEWNAKIGEVITIFVHGNLILIESSILHLIYMIVYVSCRIDSESSGLSVCYCIRH